MYRYSNEEMTFTGVLNHSMRLHYITLKCAILPILLITLVKFISALCSEFFLNPLAQLAIYSVAMILIVYLFLVALLATHYAFTDRSQSILQSFKGIFARWLPILATMVAYFIGMYLLYQFMSVMLYVIDKYVHASSPLHGAIFMITGAFLLVYIAMFSFCVPLCALGNKTILKSFRDSIILTEKNRFGVLMLFLLVGAIFLLISPASVHEYLLATYHLDVVFDFIVLCVGLPLLINWLLLIINDSKQKAVGEVSE